VQYLVAHAKEVAFPGSAADGCRGRVAMQISHTQIQNFRNFKDFNVKLGDTIVIVGENKIGKSNLSAHFDLC
jgi:ABC-type polysaccharide/polyol phosphate transport system ATPase subunit